jgi:hypothetical protein
MQKWRCAAVVLAIGLWLEHGLTHPDVPASVRWGAGWFLAVLMPIVIYETVRKWQAYRREAR